MLILKKEENLINEIEVTHFDFEKENFYIEFSEGIWKAISHDPEIDEVIIIEDLESNIKFDDESIEIFQGFIFTQDLFQQYKNILNLK